MKRTLLLICTLLCANVLWAQNLFTVGDIQYEITGTNEVEVDSVSTSATSIVIPETIDYEGITYNVTSIDTWAFESRTNLTSVTIPNSIVSIEQGAFYGCMGLTSIDIPNSVTTIDTGAFYGCAGLTSINIPNSITSIGYATFYGCSSLTSVNIPNSVTSIGDYAFYNCSSLTSVTIPESVTSINDAAFLGNTNLTTLHFNAIHCDFNLEQYRVFPNTINNVIIGENVEKIPNNFLNYSKITNITIPNSVDTIEWWAFGHCSLLTDVTLGSDLVSLGYNAFGSDSNLIRLNYNATNCTSFDQDAFANSKRISTINIGNNVETIPAYFAYDLDSLAYVTIPANVTSIGYEAFYDCDNLASVTCNAQTAPTLGSYAFSSNYYYNTLSIPYCNVDQESYSSWSNRFNYIQSSHNGLAYEVISGTNNLKVIGLADQSITELVIPATVECNGTIYNVTSIGGGAFYNCSSLTSVNIPNSVTSIGEYAFYNCSNLADVTLPENVNISYDAFYNAGVPAIITIDSVTYRVTSTYTEDFGCGLITFHIGDSTYTPTEARVSSCYQSRSGHVDILSSIEIAGNTYPVTSIGYEAFRYCSSLTSVNIPNSVTSIGGWAFAYCDALTSVTIPNSVTSIGNYAFYNAGVDASVIIDSVAYKVSPATIPDSYYATLTDNSYRISGYGLITFHIGDSTYAPTEAMVYGCYQSRSGHVDILSSIEFAGNTYPVTSIYYEAFYNCSGLTSIVIPNSVTYIGSEAFENCSGLTSITLPENITFIGYDAFYNAGVNPSVIIDSVTYLVVPATIPESYYANLTDYGYPISGYGLITFNIGDSTYASTEAMVYDCEQNRSGHVDILSSIEVGENTYPVTSIGGTYYGYWGDIESYDAFSYCSSITSVNIPNSITSIGNSAFSGCSGLTSVTIPNSVTSIGDYAFSDCSSLTSITIPNSVTSIGGGVFYNCSSLTSIDIPNSVTSIGYGAFADCSSLTSITIPNSVTSIGYYAFEYCSGLTSITIPNSVTSIGDYAFASCSSLTSVTIPNSVTSIDEGTFYNCSGLTSVTIPNSVTSIGYDAFASCNSLTSVTIGNSVTSIGAAAFFGCNFLQNITCLSTIPPTMASNNVFPYPNMAFVSVPCGSLSAYTAPTSFWNMFFMGRISELNFALNLVVNNSDWGTVNMERTNCSTVILTATANEGYHFEGWSDGETANPRTLVMTEDTEITAIFEEQEVITYNVTTGVNNEIMGSVEGAGIYVENTTATLTAVANYGYHFVAWNDGETANPRTITVTSDTNFIATFAINTYELIANVNNQSMGSVIGAGEFDYLSQVTLTAMANVGHHFVSWNDGNTNNPRTIVLTNDTIITANFEVNTYTIIANVENDAMGTVSGGGEYTYGSTATLTAEPNACFSFVAWNDGNTENPRTITVSDNASLTASFEAVVYEHSFTANICEGTTYSENGFNVSEAGTYTQTFQTVNGCDSVVTLTLNVNSILNTELVATICEGQVYAENGFNVSEAGTYTQTLQTINGCDSIVTLTLNVNPTFNTELTATICEGQTYTENGFNVNEAGTYTQTLTSVNGCDSIVTLSLNVNPTFNTELSATICQGQVYNENGFNVSEAGVYTQNLTSVNGCDSIVTLTLNVNPTFNTELVATICEGQVYNENGFEVSEAGTYTQTLQTINGCDSIVTLVVTTYPTFDTTITATINAGEMYSEFGFNESEAGTYVQNLQSINGCDSTITLILDVNSSLMDVEQTEISFYPNPTDSKITFSSTIERIEVIDQTGRCVLTFSNAREINIESLPAGAYYLRLTNNDKAIMRKVIKE